MGGKSGPEAPDYVAAAEATGQSNRENIAQQTYANRVNQTSPWGSTTYTPYQEFDPTTGQDVTRWNQDTTLTEDSQRALDAEMGLMAGRSELGESMLGRMQGEFGEEMDWSKLSERGSVPGGGMDARQTAEDALYGRATSRLDPQWEQRTSQKEAQLVAQGLRPGDKAYDQAMENMGRERTDAYQQAQFGATAAGGMEATAQQGRELTQANFQNELRERERVEEMQKRGFSLNEINAIMSGQQVGMPNMPGYATSGAAPGTDYSGAARDQYGAELDAYNSQQAGMQGLMSGAMSAASLYYSGGMFG